MSLVCLLEPVAWVLGTFSLERRFKDTQATVDFSICLPDSSRWTWLLRLTPRCRWRIKGWWAGARAICRTGVSSATSQQHQRSDNNCKKFHMDLPPIRQTGLRQANQSDVGLISA